uniref:Uncharacterized protein n=1 Tax=Anguilla anguilla TaxID=7936 RepID=A0A0E9PPG2_ANGAN
MVTDFCCLQEWNMFPNILE